MRINETFIKDLISVVIPCYNGENSIEKSVLSVVEQDYNNTEIIIVDDGSSDNTWQVCCGLAEKYPSVKPFSTENRGVSAARNFGTEKAVGEYIIYLDADDIFLPGALGCLAEAMNSVGSPCVVGKTLVNPDNNQEKTKLDTGSFNIVNEYRFTDIHSLMLKREILKNAKEFPVGITHSEDFYWANMLSPFINKIAVVDKHTYGYYIAQGQAAIQVIRSSERFVERQRNLINYIESQIENFPPEESDKLLRQLIKVRRLVINATLGECYSRNVENCCIYPEKQFKIPFRVLKQAKLTKNEMTKEIVFKIFPILQNYKFFRFIMKLKNRKS